MDFKIYQFYVLGALFLRQTKDIISIDEESTDEQRAKRIGANYQSYWIKQTVQNLVKIVVFFYISFWWEDEYKYFFFPN